MRRPLPFATARVLAAKIPDAYGLDPEMVHSLTRLWVVQRVRPPKASASTSSAASAGKLRESYRKFLGQPVLANRIP
jgi:hypothetical protein